MNHSLGRHACGTITRVELPHQTGAVQIGLAALLTVVVKTECGELRFSQPRRAGRQIGLVLPSASPLVLPRSTQMIPHGLVCAIQVEQVLRSEILRNLTTYESRSEGHD